MPSTEAAQSRTAAAFLKTVPDRPTLAVIRQATPSGVLFSEPRWVATESVEGNVVTLRGRMDGIVVFDSKSGASSTQPQGHPFHPTDRASRIEVFLKGRTTPIQDVSAISKVLGSPSMTVPNDEETGLTVTWSLRQGRTVTFYQSWGERGTALVLDFGGK